jgi:NADPH-dependent ferric siderophore reductase
MTVSWLPRGHGTHGSRLVPADTAAADRLLPAGATAAAATFHDVDVDRDILWEIPDVRPRTPLYAWLAGEAGVIRTLRRQLLSHHGLDRRSVALMGYWRLGRPDQE